MEHIEAILGLLIVVFAMVSFILERIPIALTAVIAALLMFFIGAVEAKDVYGAFGSSATVFTACMMVVGSALFNTGVIDLVVKGFQRSRMERNERLLVGAVTLISAVLSAFLSNSAVVAIFLPLIGILAARATKNLNVQLLAFSAGIGAAVGGVATLAGSTSQLVTQEILGETPGGRPMSMFTLSAVGAPLILLTVLYMTTAGYSIGSKVLAGRQAPSLAGESTEETQSSAPDGKMNWRMPFSLLILILMIIAFAIGLWEIALVALLGATVLVVTNCLPFSEVLKRIDWNTIIILSAAQAFGAGLTKSGGGQLVADAVTTMLGGISANWLILAFLSIVAMILTNFASNVALTAMFVPIAISIASSIGDDPTTWAIAITIACNIAVFTPVGTPCVTQTLAAGLRYLDYVKIGLPLAFILTPTAAVLSAFIYPSL